MIDKNTIPYKQLMELHHNYGATQDYLSDYKGKAETQSIWFEMNEDLKLFLQELLKPARSVSGLRVYICEYKNGNTPPDTSDAEYGRKLTIGMVATKAIENKRHIDHPDEINDKNNLAFAAYNHGQLCPTKCNS